MSKEIRGFFTKVNGRFNMTAKLKAAWDAGSRIVPSKTQKNDQEFQLRIDAGELVQGRYRMCYLQVNTQATNTKLREWARKNSTHAKLASTRFDTLASDPEAEARRALADLESQATKNI